MLAKEIIKRPQAIRTRDGFYQPPHRDVVDAFHGALLLRIVRIANYWLWVNMKSTELQKINCENENSESEALNILIFQCSLNMCHASRAIISWQPEANPLRESDNEPACGVLFGTDPESHLN